MSFDALFMEDLKILVNKHGIDARCGMPDFVLAAMVTNNLQDLAHFRAIAAGQGERGVRRCPVCEGECSRACALCRGAGFVLAPVPAPSLPEECTSPPGYGG